MDAEIKDINGVLQNLERDFKDVVKRNDMLVGLMRENTPHDAGPQRLAYMGNLHHLANGIEEYYNEKFPNSIKAITQIKVYNSKIKRKYLRGFFEWWRVEGLSFKYFKTMNEFKQFSQNLESIDRIDESLSEEVEGVIQRVEERDVRLARENTPSTS